MNPESITVRGVKIPNDPESLALESAIIIALLSIDSPNVDNVLRAVKTEFSGDLEPLNEILYPEKKR